MQPLSPIKNTPATATAAADTKAASAEEKKEQEEQAEAEAASEEAYEKLKAVHTALEELKSKNTEAKLKDACPTLLMYTKNLLTQAKATPGLS